MSSIKMSRGHFSVRTCRKYSEKERQRVLKDVDSMGLPLAAKTNGIPKNTIRYWVEKRSSLVEKAPGTTRDGPQITKHETDDHISQPAIDRQEAQPEIMENKTRVAKKYTPSQKAKILEEAAMLGVTNASKKFNVSRFSIYDWRRKVQRAAQGKGPSPTSGPSAQDIENLRDLEIINEYKRNPGLGPSQIRNQLRRKGVKVSVHTTRRVMEENGYRPPKVKRHEHDQRFEAARPNHLWHLDFLHRYINRASTFSLILLDDFSRFVVGHDVDDAERADLVINTFEQAVSRHGRPEMVLHDKGSAFWSWRGISRFTKLLEEMGIDQIPAEHKEWNGKLEVFNANLAKELFDVHRFYDVAEMKRRLAAHLHWYNHQRTNHALGGLLVPADRYYGRAEEALTRIEAGSGQGPDLHTIDLRDRCLELFKVVNNNGVTEVWLMGQRLLHLDTL